MDFMADRVWPALTWVRSRPRLVHHPRSSRLTSELVRTFRLEPSVEVGQGRVVGMAVGHCLGRDLAQPPGLVIRDGLSDFVLGVHHEGAVVHHWLTDQRSSEHEHLEVRVMAVLLRVSGDTNSAAGSEHGQLRGADRAAFASDASPLG